MRISSIATPKLIALHVQHLLANLLFHVKIGKDTDKKAAMAAPTGRMENPRVERLITELKEKDSMLETLQTALKLNTARADEVGSVFFKQSC